MQRIRHYGPSLTLLAVIFLMLVGGPYLVREMAWADQEARIEWAAQKLKSSARLAELSQAFRQVAQRVEPSVVHIAVSKKGGGYHDRLMPELPPDLPEPFRRFFEDQWPRRRDEGRSRRYDVPQPYGNGSGWVYDDKGHIITNYHVVRDADVIEVKFYDQTTRRAELVGADEKTDIAVIKVDADHLHPATIADRPVEQGDVVFAFGSPFSFDFSMSQGIVSGKGRRLGILGNTGYENFIQTDAAINPGNSGGPLTNIYGEVVGMNSAIATRTGAFNGLGFAIPADMLKSVIPQLIETGQVRRGYLGVLISDEPKLLKSFGVDKGVLVEDVMPDTPADKAGMKRGDVIVELDGRPAESADQLRSYVARQAPGKTLSMKIVRDGKTRSLSVKLAELPDEPLAAAPNQPGDRPGPADRTLLTKIGITSAHAMTDRDAERIGADRPVPGVFVEEVRPTSAAAAASIVPGVVITDVQGQPVTSVAKLVAELKKHDLAKGVRMTIRVFLDGRWTSRFVLLEMEE